ncbi:MAG: cytochrome ubiquinol oxidase subunit I [Sulfurospirillaceae bacterium]|nr:cytochrome ubiquinol oxidase subunit I [Sulfurospirillaceae bacterium]
MELIGLYPLFYFPQIGSAWLMGITGSIHIMASHTSVGAALLFAFLAHKAYKEDRPELYDYMKKYGMFLVIFSYVIGSITGPGIWYTATAASPRGISALIHNFVWVWATEWVFFIVEVIGVFTLIYTIGKIDRKTHLKLTYMFALASVSTLFLIIGIISFMMWPGTEAWYQTGSASDAFFGINTFPHMFLRIGFMILMSAIIGFIISSALKEKDLRSELTRKLAVIGMIGGLTVLMSFLWYVQTLPQNAWDLFHDVLWARDGMTRIVIATVITLYLILAFVLPRSINTVLAVVMMLVIGVIGVWPGEKMRESMRKPFVAGRYIYSNQLIARDVPGKHVKSEMALVAEKGLLKLDPFIPDHLRSITPENQLEAGHLIAKIACSNCHSLEKGAKFRPLPDKFPGLDAATIETILTEVIATGVRSYIPPIKLPDDETKALAAWLATQNK